MAPADAAASRLSDAAASRLSDAQLRELLGLIGDVDSVELKLTVPESARLSVAPALGIDPLDAQIRQVYFFDTPALDLDGQGLVLRARRLQGKRGDCVVKLRPVVPADLPEWLRKADGFTVEVDAMPGGIVCSGTLKRRVGNADVHAVVRHGRPIGGLLSPEQRALMAELGPDGLELEELAVLGPILVLKLKFEPEGFDRRLVAELWLYPDGSRVLELSTRCAPGDTFLAAAETRAFLSERGVDLSGEQATKTRKALSFFAERL